MKFNLIFADHNSESGIFSVIFDRNDLVKCGIDSGEIDFDETYLGKNEYQKILNLFSRDLWYLSCFYDNNKLFFDNDYWNNITEDEFIKNVREASGLINNQIENAFKNRTLDILFQPLKDDIYNIDQILLRTKSKFDKRKKKKLLRIYAIKIDDNFYCITGGAIKVAPKMQDASNTNYELKKLNYIRDYLKANNVFDCDSFIDLINENNEE